MVAVLSATRRFTVDEYYRMAEAGILHPDDHVELIEGTIVEMSPIGPRHALCVDRLNHALSKSLGEERGWLRIQHPIRLSNASEPQPDVVIARPPGTRYEDHHPGPEDILLAIEVADSSLMYDRVTKVPLYGAAGIPEVWIVDLTRNLVEIHTAPSPNGYASVSIVRRDGDLSPIAVPDIRIKASEILS